MSEIKLKPCPFCGSDAEIVYYDQYPEMYGVGCSKCPAILAELCEYKLFDSEAEAAEAWNTRAERGCGEVRDEVHIARLSNGFQCDGSVWRCCKCGAFFTNYTDLTDHHKPRFCPNCGSKVVG